MKSLICCLCLLLICLALPAAAQNDLYDNGPTDGFTIGWTINFGLAVSDTFTLANNSTVNGLTFAAWLFPGDVLQTVEVSITSSEFGGTTYFDQTVNFTAGTCFSNGGFNVCNETGMFSGVNLNAGTYWLDLTGAVVPSGDPVYWDQNSGPSLASENTLGTLTSESFTVLGTSGTSGTTPEPSSVLLFGSGILGIGTLLRRKLF